MTPCLIVQGAAKAMAFYADVFGATERMRYSGPDDTVAHAEIESGDSVLIIEDESPYRGTTAPSGGLGRGSRRRVDRHQACCAQYIRDET